MHPVLYLNHIDKTGRMMFEVTESQINVKVYCIVPANCKTKYNTILEQQLMILYGRMKVIDVKFNG